ncbi:hypothetical protein [Nonomuraea sp. CA-141351]|uniref:hypothetical protein n=1 Tax=Nonomuraea sp. CA-141351 TaxID=3239996 RepID=UPI003D91F59A
MFPCAPTGPEAEQGQTQDAYELALSAFERFPRHPVAARYGFPYDDLEDFVARGSALAEVVPVVRVELG